MNELQLQIARIVKGTCLEIAIPVHYGSIAGDISDGDTFAANVKSPTKVEFKIIF